MHGLKLIPLVAAALALPAAPVALAQKPPDNGAVDQYTEGLPGPDGETPSGGAGGGSGGGAGGGSGGGRALPPSTAEALEAAGADGEAVARIAEGTVPGGEGERGAATSTGGGAAGPAAAEDSGGLIDSVQAAVTGEEGGMGILFPLILGGTLLGAVLLLLLGRRGSGPASG
jgi:hypothetical protein